MKNSKSLINSLAIGVVLMGGHAAMAQDGTGGSTGTTMGTDTTGNREQRNDDTDYGWLGLLGLAGLAGLRKKPEQHVVHQTDTRTNPNR